MKYKHFKHVEEYMFVFRELQDNMFNDNSRQYEELESAAIENWQLEFLQFLIENMVDANDKFEFIFKIIRTVNEDWFVKLRTNYKSLKSLAVLLINPATGWTKFHETVFLKTIEFGDLKAFEYFKKLRGVRNFNQDDITNAIVLSLFKLNEITNFFINISQCSEEPINIYKLSCLILNIIECQKTLPRLRAKWWECCDICLYYEIAVLFVIDKENELNTVFKSSTENTLLHILARHPVRSFINLVKVYLK